VAIPWLAARHGAEVVTVTVDVGQRGALDDVQGRALRAGAARAHVVDKREEFAAHLLLPALQSGALTEARPDISTALARLLVARELVAIAGLEGASQVAHAASDPETCDFFARAIRSMEPRMEVLAPQREWSMTRSDQAAYAKARDIQVLESAGSSAQGSSNLWTRSAGLPPARRPSTRAVIALRIEQGVPVAVNDVELPLVDLFESVATIAATHGLGRTEIVHAGSAAGRCDLDAPASGVLCAAYGELRATVLAARGAHALAHVAAEHTRSIATGRWLSTEIPRGPAVDLLPQLSGTVRLELSQGACRVIGCDAAPARAAVSEDDFTPLLVSESFSPARV
jgi:argininosuccinate synthase